MDDLEHWRVILKETLLYGMLFKAVARDGDSLANIELKMSYKPLLDAISIWAERKHHVYRRQFERLGGKIHAQGSHDGFFYVVLVTVRGLQHENVYNAENLRADCQDRLNQFLQVSLDR